MTYASHNVSARCVGGRRMDARLFAAGAAGCALRRFLTTPPAVSTLVCVALETLPSTERDSVIHQLPLSIVAQ